MCGGGGEHAGSWRPQRRQGTTTGRLTGPHVPWHVARQSPHSIRIFPETGSQLLTHSERNPGSQVTRKAGNFSPWVCRKANKILPREKGSRLAAPWGAVVTGLSPPLCPGDRGQGHSTTCGLECQGASRWGWHFSGEVCKVCPCPRERTPQSPAAPSAGPPSSRPRLSSSCSFQNPEAVYYSGSAGPCNTGLQSEAFSARLDFALT